MNEGVVYTTNMAFFIDGEAVGSYSHIPSGETDFLYNVSCYANASIPDGQHEFVVQAAGGQSSVFLFDYLIYT